MSAIHGDNDESYEFALHAAESGDISKASRIYRRLLKDPGVPRLLQAQILNDLGCIHFSRSEWQEAHDCLSRSLELNENSEETRENLEALHQAPSFPGPEISTPETQGITVIPKKHVLYYSLESKNRAWFECYGGGYPSPNFSRLAQMSQKFLDMSSAGCSTAFSLSAAVSGRFPHHFDRANYSDTSWFDDNLFMEMHRLGKKCFFVSSDSFIDEYWQKIHAGPHVTCIPIPEAQFTTMVMAETVAEILAKADEPCFIFSHAFPLKGCDPKLKSTWRNGMERFVWDCDRALGHILDHVDLERTTLLVCADHGNSLGENSHLFSHAFFPYQPQVGVPCFVTGAGVGVVKGAYSNIQIRDLLLGHKITPLPVLFMDTLYPLQPHRVTAVRFDDWKYIAHYSPATAVTGLQEELYDLRYDASESRNLLFDKAEHPLRSDWNSDCLYQSLGGQYSYEKEALVQQLNRGRKLIAQAWNAPFVEQVGRQVPGVSPQLAELFAKSSDLAIIQAVGKLANELSPGPHCYEKLKQGQTPPKIPVPLKSVPQATNSIEANFSSLGLTELRPPSILV